MEPPQKHQRVGRIAAAITGMIVAIVGLGVAELAAGLKRNWRSPVLDVGDRVIDHVPRWAKEFAIARFGSNDKTALLIGIGLMLAVYAAIVGIIAFRHRLVAGMVGIAAFGLLGAWAAIEARTHPPVNVAIPSIIGALVATLLLAFIARASAVGDPVASGPAIDQDAVEPVAVHEIAGEPVAVGPVVGEPDAAELIGQPSGELTGQPAAESDGERMVLYRGDEQYGQPVTATSRPSSTSRTATAVDRRRFLMLSAGALAVGAAAFAGGRKLGGRFDAAASRARVMLPAALKPLAAIDPKAQLGVEGISPFFTPNGGFYRVDINLAVPNIAAETWSLRIHGMVDHELNLSYEELLKRKLVESDITLTCVSNEVGGSLLGTARWLGVRLDDLLAEAGIKAGADQVVGRSTDGYTCGFPVAALDGRDALVAIGMNGEPLPLAHGFPARLIVPGLYGYVSATKWLAEIELGRFDQLDQYWVQRGWVTDAPIKMSSRIDTPRGLSKVTAGTTVAIGGVAWAQPVGVSAVEVRIDDGGWMPAELGAKVNNTTWRQWKYAWAATAGRHTITVRAIDEKGAIQIEGRSEPFPSGSTGWHQIIVIGQ